MSAAGDHGLRLGRLRRLRIAARVLLLRLPRVLERAFEALGAEQVVADESDHREHDELDDLRPQPVRLHRLPLAPVQDEADHEGDHAPEVEDDDDREQVVVDLVRNVPLRDAPVPARM